MATPNQDEEKSSIQVLILLFTLLLLLFASLVWYETQVASPARERHEDARAICLAREGAILKRPLVLKNQFLVPVGNQWCSVHTLKGHDVADQIKAALTAKP